MQRMILALVAGMVLTVLGYSGFSWLSAHYLPLAPEAKLTRAFPPPPEMQARWQRVDALARDAGNAGLAAQMEIRMRQRSLACSPGYLPAWYERIETVRQRVANPTCFAAQDRKIERWLALLEVGAMLRLEPLRAIPAQFPEALQGDAPLVDAVFAERAGIALLQTRRSLQVIDVGRDQALYREPSDGQLRVGSLSENGRLFVSYGSKSLRIREAETGRTVAQIHGAYPNSFIWLDGQTALFQGRSHTQFIDFSQGRIIDTELYRQPERAAPVPGKPDHYVAFGRGGAVELALEQRTSVPKVRVVRLQDSRNTAAAALDSEPDGGAFSLDGTQYLSPLRPNNLAVFSIGELKNEVIETGPFKALKVIPTADPDKLLFGGSPLPFSQATVRAFVLDTALQRLAPVTEELNLAGLSYVRPLGVFGAIDASRYRLIKTLPVGEEVDLVTWRDGLVQEALQRRVEQIAAQGSAPVRQPVSPSMPDVLALTGQMPPRPQLPIPSEASSPSRTTPVQVPVVDTQVEVIGVYESARGQHGGGEHHPGVIDVEVRKSQKPLTLVLSSYEPITWKLDRQPGSRIHQVLLSSYHPSTVEGAGDARVIVVKVGYDYQASGYRTLPPEVTNLTGQQTGLYQGTYSGGRFSVGGGP